MHNTLVLDKWRALNPRLVDNTIPLKELDMCDLKVDRRVIEVLDMFVIVDNDADEYLMMKSRSPANDHGKVFKDLTTLQPRLQTYYCWVNAEREVMNRYYGDDE